MKNFKLCSSFLFILILIIGCQNSDSVTEQSPINAKTNNTEFSFLMDSNCELQTTHTNQLKNVKLILFDEKGMTDEETYARSHSVVVKKKMLADSEFIKLAKENFDFIAVTQDCKAGQDLANKYGVKKFPGVVFLDNNGKAIINMPIVLNLYERPGEFADTPVVNLDILKRYVKVKLKKMVTKN